MDVLRTNLAAAEVAFEAALARETYWRERCERLCDAAMARAGNAPVLQDRKPAGPSQLERIATAMAIKEIDSTARPSKN